MINDVQMIIQKNDTDPKCYECKGRKHYCDKETHPHTDLGYGKDKDYDKDVKKSCHQAHYVQDAEDKGSGPCDCKALSLARKSRGYVYDPLLSHVLVDPP